MVQTISEMLKDEGRLEGEIRGRQQEALAARRAILLRQLRKKFKKVPRKVATRIAATTNLQELESWLDNVVAAATLADVGIPL
jgi:ribosomal protein S4